jgi:RNA-splicing ligase RtcB
LDGKYVVHAHVDEESYRIVASAKVERYLSKEKPDICSGSRGEYSYLAEDGLRL